MEINTILQTCTAIIIRYSDKDNLQEFELLMYEQACRVMECLLKTYRETWDAELEDYTR